MGGTKARAVTALAIAVALTATTHTVRADGDPQPGAVASRWIERALAAVRSGSPGIHTSTPGAARTYAMTAAAMYDAVNGIDVAAGASTRTAAIIGSYADAPADGDPRAAAAAAAHRVLASLFSGNAAVKGSVDAALADDLAALGSDPSVEAGRAWGASVGAEVVAIRAGDGSQSAQSQTGGHGPGVFPRTFSGTQFRLMRPFGVASTAPYASSGPPALTSERYAEDVNEVQRLGSLLDDDPERSTIARHWLAEANTVRETGLWFKIALNVAAARGTVSSLSDTVRMFALLGMGIADAVTTSWGDKHGYRFWRPGDAIRRASTDGNPLTVEDPAWNPRGGACASADIAACAVFGGTPEHTSGTSTFAGAASTILASFYCTDHVPFAFSSEAASATTRSYSSFSEAAKEAGRSRIYAGIHFQFSVESGREAGKGIGKEIVRNRLLPGGMLGASAVCTHAQPGL